MIKYLTILLSLILGSLLAPAQDSLRHRTFPSAELFADLDFLFAKLEEIHPDLYHYTPKKDIDAMREKVKREFTPTMTRLDFALKIIPIVTSLKDAHTGLALPQEERTEYLKTGGVIFPLDVIIREKKLLIKYNFSTDMSIGAGDEIIAINGINAELIRSRMGAYISAELDIYRDVRVEREFRRLLLYLYGPARKFVLEINQGGVRVKKEIAARTAKELEQTVAKMNIVTRPKAYSFRTITGTSIGIIDFWQMNNEKAFKIFLDSAFTQIKRENLRHVVIDIRQNSGGNSKLAEMLFNYITNKPYKMTESVDIKADGKVRTISETRMKYPANESKFTGKIWLLTSHYTFSSANMLADAVKCYGLGTIVGEETGGVLEAFGDLVPFELPFTRLIGACPFKKFVHPCHDGKPHGVMPDIEIIPSIEDVKTGRDAVMEYVIHEAK